MARGGIDREVGGLRCPVEFLDLQMELDGQFGASVQVRPSANIKAKRLYYTLRYGH
jgi:hypothetical protein